MTDHTEHGDGEIARAEEILRTEVGSGLHGIAIAGTDDHDEMGVFVEPPDRVIGMGAPMDTYNYRTQPEGHRSGPGDTDLVMYSLRKYLRLASAGNPTVLAPLFAPAASVYATTELGDELRAMAPAFLSQQAVQRHVGYLDGQMQKLLGSGGQGNMPKRPELVEQYGYDTKFASHALRLGLQGLQLIKDRHLALPMTGADRDQVIAMKTGYYATLAEAVAAIDEVRQRLVTLIDTGQTGLPERPDAEHLSAWSVSAHLRHWSMTL